MTRGRLVKLLLGLGAPPKVGRRVKVVIDKRTFAHPLERDGCVYLDVEHVDVRTIHMRDDDGGRMRTVYGEDVMRRVVVLSGAIDAPRSIEEPRDG